ncbi:MAG: substrate-binding domain-containing protein [Desulfatibacillum sp.]|nr:substrate-binding domain-containing protein [Desulfatibacillum sp.]
MQTLTIRMFARFTGLFLTVLLVLSLSTESWAEIQEASGAKVQIVIGGTGSSLGAARLLGEAFMEANPGVAVKVLPSLGSSGGIKALLQKKVDLALSVRPLKKRELVQGLTSIAYAMTPFVFATTAASSGSGVTKRQLADIYSGDSLTWPDGSPIHLIVRPPKESDTLLIRSMSSEMDKAMDKALKRNGMMFAVTDQETADLLESIKGSLASLSLGQIIAEQRNVKVLALEGIPPLIDAKVNPAYSYYKTYYLIFRPDMSSTAREFVEYILSAQGREILESSGHFLP